VVPVGSDLHQVEEDFVAATLALLEEDGANRQRRSVRALSSSNTFVVSASASTVACSAAAANDNSQECLSVDINITSKASQPASLEQVEAAAIATAEAVEDGTFVEELKNTSTGSNVVVELPPAVTDAPTESPTIAKPVCKDSKAKHKLKYSGNKIKGKCKKIKNLKLCDWSDHKGVPLWELCPVSCKAFIPSEEKESLPCKF